MHPAIPVAFIALIIAMCFLEHFYFTPRKEVKDALELASYAGRCHGGSYESRGGVNLPYFYDNNYTDPARVHAYDEGFKTGIERAKQDKIAERNNLANFQLT